MIAAVVERIAAPSQSIIFGIAISTLYHVSPHKGGANNECLRVHYWCPDSVMRNLVFIDRTCQVRQH